MKINQRNLDCGQGILVQQKMHQIAVTVVHAGCVHAADHLRHFTNDGALVAWFRRLL